MRNVQPNINNQEQNTYYEIPDSPVQLDNEPLINSNNKYKQKNLFNSLADNMAESKINLVIKRIEIKCKSSFIS
jgi:hypothetical protein